MSEKFKCPDCGKEKILKSGFYKSYSPLHQGTGFTPICKDCIKKKFDKGLKEGKQASEVLIEICKVLDKPYIQEVFDNVVQRNNGVFSKIQMGSYFKEVHMKQWLKMGIYTFKDSMYKKENRNSSEININLDKLNEESLDNKIDKILSEINNEETTKDGETVTLSYLESKWGLGYSPEELVLFEKKYLKLHNNYEEITEMHTEALLTYIRYRVKEEMATAKGSVNEAKSWGGLAKDAAEAAKIKPSQLSKADLTDGLSTFSELSQAIEQAKDVVPILPKFKYRPNDALDFNIWCYINYDRHLSGLPLCKYEDIYKFYDERIKEYIEQYGDPYGIFEGDTSKSNRENIKKFIKSSENNE